MKYILFDLDGTLTESAIGIKRCVQYALEHFNINENNDDKLLSEYLSDDKSDKFRKNLKKFLNKVLISLVLLIGSLISIIGLIYVISELGKKLYDKINYAKKYKVYKIITLIIFMKNILDLLI